MRGSTRIFKKMKEEKRLPYFFFRFIFCPSILNESVQYYSFIMQLQVFKLFVYMRLPMYACSSFRNVFNITITSSEFIIFQSCIYKTTELFLINTLLHTVYRVIFTQCFFFLLHLQLFRPVLN